MPHQRPRFIVKNIKEAQAFWPVVGVLGARQVGKTTLLREQTKYNSFVTLDDDDIRKSASESAKIFLAQFDRPLVIDEITKVPDIFDAIKSCVDKKRIPNQFLITGSTQFSAKLGIRESLTGRMGLIKMNPLTLAEALEKECRIFKDTIHKEKPRFSSEQVVHHMIHGGMPVPMFLREPHLVDEYWQFWLETTIYRDVSKLFKRGFDPELAFEILNKIAAALCNGELPSLAHINIKNIRKARTYLEAFETVFLLRRLRCHEDGVGKDVWMVLDSGLALYLMKRKISDEATLTLARHFLVNETNTLLNLKKTRDERVYYKSAKGTHVDWVWDGIPYKVITSIKSIGWAEKALIGAMKKLKSKVGYFIAPTDYVTQPDKDSAIGILPWSFWS